MVIDLKVLVRTLIAGAVHVMLETLAKVFFFELMECPRLCQTNSIEEPVLFPPAPPKINVASTSAVQTTSVRQAPNNFDLKGCGEGRFWIANSMSRLMLIHRNVQLSR